MKGMFSLFRVLSKNAEMKAPTEGDRGRLYRAMGIIAVCCIMLPCCIIVGYVSYVLGYALTLVNAPIAGLQAEIHIMSAFSLIFGILVILNILFFSSDREHLVSLPIKSEDILAAKFLYSYIAESVMEFLILISMFIGFFIAFFPAYHFKFFSLLAGIIGVAVIPLLPLAYCAIISLLLMASLKGLKSGKILNHISTLLFLLFVALFLFSFQGMGGITIENYVDSLSNHTNLFTNVLDKIFFTVPLLLSAIEQNNFLYLLLYLLVNAAVVALMLLLGHFLYLPGLHTVARLGNGHKSGEKIKLKTEGKSVFSSYLQKEIRVLTRTRAYATNCVYVNLLWPFAMIMIYVFNHKKETYQKLITLYKAGNERMILFIFIGVILVSFIASAMNSLASTAFTREGKHLSLLKYIPVPYITQLKAKAVVTLIFSLPPLLLCIVLMGIAFSFSPLMYIMCILLLCTALIITTMAGLYLDSSQPHSLWDDEYSALRGNLNTFYNMGMIMVISILIAAIGFLLYSLTGIGVTGTAIFYLTVMIVLAGLSIILLPGRIIENMKQLY